MAGLQSRPPPPGALLLRITDAVARLALAASVFCAVLILVLILASVSMRYLFRAPFPFTEDIAGLLLFSQVALAVPFTVVRNDIISLDVLRPASSRLLGWAQALAAATLLASVCGALSYGLIAEGIFSQRRGIQLEVSDMPVAPWLYLGAFGFALSAACAFLFIPATALRGKVR
jgi:TRAP-type C4-dicarboxylate transport system permease small subunit